MTVSYRIERPVYDQMSAIATIIGRDFAHVFREALTDWVTTYTKTEDFRDRKRRFFDEPLEEQDMAQRIFYQNGDTERSAPNVKPNPHRATVGRADQDVHPGTVGINAWLNLAVKGNAIKLGISQNDAFNEAATWWMQRYLDGTLPGFWDAATERDREIRKCYALIGKPYIHATADHSASTAPSVNRKPGSESRKPSKAQPLPATKVS